MTDPLSESLSAALREHRPGSDDALHAWIASALGVVVPRHPLLSGSAAPFDYIRHAFFEDREPRDVVVWGARGSGKTFYAALATALDLAFKPGIEIKILGGSLQQSARMHQHLRDLLARPVLAPLVRDLTDRRVTLSNNSTAEILAQSERAVRGSRPQKLRCDEVELFDPEVWQAAQFVTRSKHCGGTPVHASIEALSTWHRPHGLMRRLVESEDSARTLFRWGVIDVLERCPPESDCDSCILKPECAGRAKRASGHLPIDDARTMKQRADRASWRAEMLCEKPSRRSAVLPEFDADRHVVSEAPDPSEDRPGLRWLAGMDLGLRSPTVLLLAAVDEANTVTIVDEHCASGIVLAEHFERVIARNWRPQWIGVDPAAAQRSLQTGLSDTQAMRRMGMVVRSRRLALDDGLRLIRARLAPAASLPTLRIHRRCVRLIESIEAYRYPEDQPDAPPVKDGNDHAVDALRYLLAVLDGPSTTPPRVTRWSR
ncbi:MAG: hypothetical protein ACIAQF_08630 [Phycisphaerales bacterium JB065]